MVEVVKLKCAVYDVGWYRTEVCQDVPLQTADPREDARTVHALMFRRRLAPYSLALAWAVIRTQTVRSQVRAVRGRRGAGR